MFSGIVEKKVRALKFIKTKDGLRVSVPVPKDWSLKLGESVNIDGVCSTIESLKASSFNFFYMPETLSKTTFGKISKDHEFNLEKSLTLQSLVGGHLVSGHVDTTGKIVKITNEAESRVLQIKLKENFAKYIVNKGSICVNGVSLTVVSVNDNSFTVSLIPYTLTHTNLGRMKKKDLVNIEVDLIAKYLEKLTNNSKIKI